MTTNIEFGLSTFGDVTVGTDSRPLPHAQVIRQVVEQGVFADQVGLDFFGVGEHHRQDLAISCPEMVLAAIASQTKRIRLGSAVTVLSADDPIRLFQRFSTLNATSQGRAEIILGRGWFTEAFDLFGYDVASYENLFDKKLGIFSEIINRGSSACLNRLTGGLQDVKIFPPLEDGKLKTWIAVGSTPASVLRAVNYDMPMIIASIGGNPTRFKPFVDLYLQGFMKADRIPKAVGIHSSGFICGEQQEAEEAFWVHYKAQRDRLGAERGWPPIEKKQYVSEIQSGSLYVGSPSNVARKIAKTILELGVSRFVMRYSSGTLSHSRILSSIEMYGTQVVPIVRDIIGKEYS